MAEEGADSTYVVNHLCVSPKPVRSLTQRPAASTRSPGSGVRAVGGDLLERIATTDRLHGDLGLELGAVGSALLIGARPVRGGATPQR